jgi:hypothetical protein
MNHIETSTESARITLQQRARRDLLSPSQPWIVRLNDLSMLVLKLQLCFCGAVLVLGSLWPSGARMLAVVVSPIARLVFLVHGHYKIAMDGPLGRDFNLAVTGETFFVTLLLFVSYQAVYLGRYWKCPWRFNEFYMEQLGVRRNGVSAAITALIAIPIAVLLGAVLGQWLGIGVAERPVTVVKPYQLALWCWLMPAAALSLVLALPLSVSSVMAALRRLFI